MNNVNFNIPSSVKDLNRNFKSEGFVFYAVGGCVRDSILGLHPKDWDLTTDANKEQIETIIKNMGWVCLPIGEQFSIMTAVCPFSKESFEIASFRKDSLSSNGRKPDSTSSASIELDAARRDFTINSLYLDFDTLEILDPSNSGGVDDLKSDIIKTVGIAQDRFCEDELRKLRAVRFALNYGFVLNSDTDKAISNNPSLKNVSKERIAQEIRRIKAVFSVSLHMLNRLGLIKSIFGSDLNETIDIVSSSNIWIKLITLWCISNSTHPKNIFSKLDVTVEEKRIIEFLFGLNTKTELSHIQTIKMFDLIKSQITLHECLEFADDKDLVFAILTCRERVKSNDLRLFGLEGKELGEAMEKLQESFSLEAMGID